MQQTLCVDSPSDGKLARKREKAARLAPGGFYANARGIT
jgi:hypothetical protein